MKKIILMLGIVALATGCSSYSINESTLSAGSKVLQAATLTDAQINEYVKEYVTYSDQQNTVCPADDPYTLRLQRIIAPVKNEVANYNFKVYRTNEVNAFACADGSIRVYTGLMDLMADNEVLGVIGHEIGHVVNKDTKDAFRTSLLTSALRDGAVSTGGTVAALTSSQLGDLAESLANAKYSRKQETEADDFGYGFLKSHDVNPWGMAMAFEKLKQASGGSATPASAIQLWFSSHPDTDARIKRMSERATADGFVRPAAQ